MRALCVVSVSLVAVVVTAVIVTRTMQCVCVCGVRSCDHGGVCVCASACAGGSTVVVVGTNFGPAAAALVVTYSGGSDGRTYGAACTRLAPSPTGVESLTCACAAGVGFGHRWVATVETVSSPPSADTTSYELPVILGITGASWCRARSLQRSLSVGLVPRVLRKYVTCAMRV
jgi:hypothetical protein